jgi:ubiquinone/menaquinone biosynthesis C-methylase UbiE
MHADERLKERVRAHWEAAPCGTPDVVDVEERQRWSELERIRYEREPFIEEFARFSAASGKQLLEVGCGAGTDLLRFARSGARCAAIDLTEAGIALAGKRLAAEGFTAELQVADAEHLPFNNDSFDVVYSWGVIHHSPDTGRCAHEILRVLRPGGRFCVMVYNRRSLLAAQAWLYFAVARGQPTRSIASVLAEHVESPGTKAYTRREAKRLFEGAHNVDVATVVTPYDLRIGRRRFLPFWTAHVVPRRLGWFHVVTGEK